MGCASSTPMIQTSGSEMLKAATHAATDATKSAEEAVEGIKDSVGKTLETAKDSAATTLENVKHEVETVVKDKSEMLEDATNSLMEKLHLKQTVNESKNENGNENSENIVKTETVELKTQLNEHLKNSTAATDELADGKVEQPEASNEIKEHMASGTDTETDSLKTSTPEPEIEQAFAKSQNSPEDGNDNPPTPKPTLAELEQLTAEFLKEQHQKPHEEGTAMVNDMTAMSNDPVISVKHEHIKIPDSNSSSNMVSLTAGNNTIKENEPTTTATTTLANNSDSNTTNVHNTPKKTPTAVNTNHFQANTLAATTITTTAALISPTNQPQVVKNKGKPQKPKNHLKQPPVSAKTEEKRPSTTEWEKFADMLAQIRKFNPHDALRRGGTYTKFGGVGGGIGQLRERPLGHHARSGMDDDCSDTVSSFRGSPQNSQRSSARRATGTIQHVPNRPNTGNNRRNAGGHYAYKTRRSSHVSSSTGRKFDYNPTRSRLNDFVSSTTFSQSYYLQNTADTQTPYALYSTSHEGVITPPNMRSHHSCSDMIALPPLETQERVTSRSQTPQVHQHLGSSASAVQHNGNCVPLATDFYAHDGPVYTRQTSNISLSTNSSDGIHFNSIKSSNLDVKLQTPKLPTIRNTSSFLATPRSPFSLRKSYTDLYFSTKCNNENKPKAGSHKSPLRNYKSKNVCSKKLSIK